MGKKRSQGGSKPGNSGRPFLGKKNFKAKDNFNAKESAKKKATQAAKQFGGNKKGGPVSQFPKFGGSPKGKKGNQNANKQGGKSNLQVGKKRPLPFDKKGKHDNKSNKKAEFKTNGSAVPFKGAMKKKNTKSTPIVNKPSFKPSPNKQGSQPGPKPMKKIQKTAAPVEPDFDFEDDDFDEDEDFFSEEEPLDEPDEVADEQEMMDDFDESDDEDLSDFDLDESEDDDDEDEESDEDAPGRIVQIDEVKSGEEEEEDESDDEEPVPAKKTKLAIEAPKPKQKSDKKPVTVEPAAKKAKSDEHGKRKEAVELPNKERSIMPGNLEKLAQEVKSRMDNIRQRCIHVQPIPRCCNFGMLKEVAREMIGCRIPIKINNRETRGYAFLEFRTPAVAQKYKQLLDGKMMNGKFLKTSEVKGGLFHFSGIESYDLKRLYVSGLARETTKVDLKNVFPKCVSVDMNITKDNSSVGFATVTFTSEEDAIEAFDLGHGAVVKGHTLCVNFLNKIRSRQKDMSELQQRKKEANIERELNLIKKDKNAKKDQEAKKELERKKKTNQISEESLLDALKTLRYESEAATKDKEQLKRKEENKKELKKQETKKQKKGKEATEVMEADDNSEELEEEEDSEQEATTSKGNQKENEKMKKAHEAILKMLENEDIDDDEDDEEDDEEEDDEDDEDDEEEDDGEVDDEEDDDDEDDNDDDDEKVVPIQKVETAKVRKKFGKK